MTGVLEGLEPEVARYEDAVVNADPAAAASVVRRLLAGGADPTVVLLDVIAAVQRRVGDRWQSGEWSVPQEHAATSVAVGLAEEIVRHVRASVRPTRTLLMACPEQEWHALPALLTAGVLAAGAWDVTLLGASTPPGRLAAHLHDRGPDATGISCSVIRSLPAARRFVEASTAAGVPVLAGGPAFGPDDLRARALGATGWAPDARSAVDVLATFPDFVPPTAPLDPAAVTEHAELERRRDAWVEEVVRGSGIAVIVTADPADAGILQGSVEQLLHALSGALLTGDPRPVPEAIGWAGEVLGARGYDPRSVGELVDVLRERVTHLPRTSALLG